MKFIISIVVTLLLALGIFSISGCQQIDPGYRGVKVTWGEVQKGTLNEGLYFYTPIKDSIVSLDARETVANGEMDVFSKDAQQVVLKYAITYYPQRDKMDYLYTNYGKDYAIKILTPLINGELKAVAGKYTAQEMIYKRAELVNDINNIVIKRAKERFMEITKVDIVDINFSREFKNSIESKVIAEQEAEREKNVTAKIREVSNQNVVRAEAEAKANLVKAKAEAEAILVKAEAEAKSIDMRTKALEKSKALVDYEAVKQWNGVLPTYMLGNSPVPFIKVGSPNIN